MFGLLSIHSSSQVACLLQWTRQISRACQRVRQHRYQFKHAAGRADVHPAAEEVLNTWRTGGEFSETKRSTESGPQHPPRHGPRFSQVFVPLSRSPVSPPPPSPPPLSCWVLLLGRNTQQYPHDFVGGHAHVLVRTSPSLVLNLTMDFFSGLEAGIWFLALLKRDVFEATAVTPKR